MGKKLDTAYERIKNQAEHHIKLAQTRGSDYDKGFSQAFYEALIIVADLRGKLD